MALENKTKQVLNLRELDGEDRKISPYVLNVIANLMRKNLDREDVQEIYKQGIQVLFRGNSPLPDTGYQNYVLSYPTKVSKELPVKLKVNCDFSTLNHAGIVRNKDPIVAGILKGDRFSSFSSTWMKEAPLQSPAYNFGEYVNEIMLDHFDLD